jgi:phage-related baseplate assembly protein
MVAPNLTGQTAQSIREAAFAKWEALANEPARIGTPEGLMIELISFIAGLNNAEIQRGLEGGLLNYALGENLEVIGLLFGLNRLSGESDEDYRERILLAPAKFTTAGSEEAIKSIVKQVDNSITDVSAIVTNPPNVPVRFITKDGLPNATLIAKVLATLQDPKVRPVCVIFSVNAPTVRDYTITANIIHYTNADIGTLPTRCAVALNSYIASVRSTMGRDVVINQIVGVLQGVAGVYKAIVTSPTTDINVSSTQWATAPTVTAANISLIASVRG